MIVCSCKAVSSAQLEELVAGGADSVEAIGRVCGAGTDCGSCRAQLEAIVAGEAPVPLACCSTDPTPDGTRKRSLPIAARAA